MPAPDLHITWDDQSAIPPLTTNFTDDTDYPIFLTVITTDKGPEEWKQAIKSDEFYEYYGRNISFEKHGQPLIQAANIVDASGRLTVKRVVAEDATLANIGLKVDVNVTKQQAVDPTTNLPLYINNATNSITTVPQYLASGAIDPASIYNVNKIDISFSLVSISMMGNDLTSFANTFYATNKHTNEIGTSGSYALMLITDNGRGESNKRFRIYKDTSRSMPVTYTRYFLEISENGTILETLPFTMNPNIVEKSRNSSIEDVVLRNSKQIRVKFFEDEFNAFTENVSYLAGLSDNEYAYADCLFGTDLYGEDYGTTPNGASINVSLSPVNPSSIYGIQLLGGSNGEFGDAPIKAATYAIQVTKAFDGSFDDSIYDLDNNRVDVIFDANYPEVVKRNIEDLVNFREDCMFFRDLGLSIRSIEDIRIAHAMQSISRSRFCATYITSYFVYDPYTYKQINVTIMYDLARLFVAHFVGGRSRPFCGQKYGVIIPLENYVTGSINFAPKHTPKVDQKAELDTLRVNYATFYDGAVLAVACEYTSQTQYTQLSFINNVLAVQEVIKAIRTVCPKIRYSFIDDGSDDFAKYKEDIDNLIMIRYANRFKSFSIEYVTDEVYTLNKIIYAVLSVKFRDFVQTEYFKITALI